jgi:hypothetical protein
VTSKSIHGLNQPVLENWKAGLEDVAWTTYEADTNLQRLVSITNRLSREHNDGDRNTCILTSYALIDVLQRLNFKAYPLRVEAAAFPDDRNLSTGKLGGNPYSSPPAGPGMWKGHLVVAIGKEWLLDPTLDQVNEEEWPACYWVEPLAVKLVEDFWNGRSIFVRNNESIVRYTLYLRQHGFAAVENARSCYWKPLSDKIID